MAGVSWGLQYESWQSLSPGLAESGFRGDSGMWHILCVAEREAHLEPDQSIVSKPFSIWLQAQFGTEPGFSRLG